MSDGPGPQDLPSSSSIHKANTSTQPSSPVRQQQEQQQPAPVQAAKSKEPSLFIQSVRAIFGFRKTSLTLFVALTYIIVFLLVPLAQWNSMALPAKEPAILSTAWLDLQEISRKPHPYVSKANDEVHDYILERAKALAKRSSLDITVDDDAESGLSMFDISQSWKNSSKDFYPLHYFESSNVLVKIQGTSRTLDGVLLSAHYDSVPTAYGTTDDGGGVASLLGVLEYYATTGEQPLRTIVFNFNNNEEFGLFGAQVFFNHKWSKEVKYVINLEGTGTGERAVLFRTTDYGVAKHYSDVRAPFATSIFQQAFASGVIRSETDYRIYTQNGMRGFDIAFYKPRSLYHTASDSIKHTSKNALWHMLGNTLDLTRSLANADVIDDDADTPAVYFDFLGVQFVVVKYTWLFNINVALLSVVPVVLLFFGVIISKRKIWSTGFSFLRLPVSVFVAGVVSKIVNDVIFYFNPYIVSSDFMSPLLTVGATFLFVNYAILTTSQSLWPVHDLKLVITLEVFTVLWIFLLLTTISSASSTAYSGTYLLTIFYALYAVSCILGLFGIAVASPRSQRSVSPMTSYGSIDSTTSAAGTIDQTMDESAPLLPNSIPQFDSDTDAGMAEDEPAHPEHNSFTYDWSLQYLILVPVTFLMSYVSMEMCLEGLNQTVQESAASHVLVFNVILAFAVVLTVPLLSFAYKLNFMFAIVLIATILISGLTSLVERPFSAASPIKFRTAQTIDLSGDVTPYLEAFGREGFLKEIFADLPSVKSSDAAVTCESQGDGNELCHYAAERPYLVEGSTQANELESYLSVEVITPKDAIASPYSPMKAELNITALNNRFCDLKFNTTSYSDGNGKSPIRIVTYYHDKQPKNKSIDSVSVNIPSGGSVDEDGNQVYKWLSGIDEVHLHKLDWDQQSYHIGLQWVPKWLEEGEEQQPIDSPENDLGLQVTCYWGEYDETVSVGGEIHRKIPAFDEVLQYSPETTSWSNRFEGLVKIEKYIEL